MTIAITTLGYTHKNGIQLLATGTESVVISVRVPIQKNCVSCNFIVSGDARKLDCKIEKLVLSSDQNTIAFLNIIHRRDALYSVLSIYSDFTKIIYARPSDYEALKHLENLFRVVACRFTASGRGLQFRNQCLRSCCHPSLRCFTTKVLVQNLHRPESSHTSRTSTFGYLKHVKYYAVAEVLYQFDKTSYVSKPSTSISADV